jgi:hypothetical protein
MSSIYTEDIEEGSDVYTVADFKETCKTGGFIDYDGMGSPAKDGKVAPKVEHWVYPSSLIIPDDATHIVWYNR